MKILGIDASTTTIGICILNIETDPPTIQHIDYYKPRGKGKVNTNNPQILFSILSNVRKFISNIIKEHNPDIVAIEDIAKFFPKKSSAQTITLLTALNRTVGTAAFDLNKCPQLLNILQIRHKIKLEKKIPEKEKVPEVLSVRLGIPFPYVYNKGRLIDENYDMADALAVALTAFYIKKGNNEFRSGLQNS